MVSETIVETQVEADQVPAPEVTEDAPAPVEEAAVAAPAEGEAAVEAEPQQVEESEPPRKYTQDELDVLAEQRVQQRIEYDRQQRQSYERRKADEAAAKEREAAKLTETVETGLIRAGVNDDELVKSLVNRVTSARGEVVTTAVEEAFTTDLSTALGYFTAPARGDTRTFAQWDMNPRQAELARQLGQAYETGLRSAAPSPDMIPRSELPKLVDAELQRRNAKAREGKTDVAHVEGSATQTNDLASWETRVAHQGEEGYPMLSDSEWREYRQIRKANGL